MNLPIATNVTGLPDGPWQTLLTHAFHILDDMQLHSGVFLDQLKQRKTLIQAQFEAIDTLTFKPSFEDAFAVASQFLRSL